MDQLTPREYQVAMLVARGLSNREIARQMGVSNGTVKLYVHSILQKLGVRSRYVMIFRLGSTSAEISHRALPSKFGDGVNSRNEWHSDRVSSDSADHNLEEQDAMKLRLRRRRLTEFGPR